MSSTHLTAGSPRPPKQEGKLRLYGMHFCPFVQRVKLVLNAKGIPYDVVNVNLKKKPEWLLVMHPKGSVPVLDTGDEVVIESLDIVDFLEEKYPQPALYSADKAKDKALIQKFGKFVSSYSAALFNREGKLVTEIMAPGTQILEEFEAELAARGTTFFGGKQPGMVDYIMWPSIERAKLPYLIWNEELNFDKDRFPKIVAWKRAMEEIKAVKDTIVDLDSQLRFYSDYITGDVNVKFDNV